MQVTRENLSTNKVKLTIALDDSEWNQVLDRAAAKLAETRKVEGFRPGKAPRDVIVARLGEGPVLSEAIEFGVEEYYPKAARQEGLRPVAFPALSVEKATITDALVFNAEVSVLPEVKLGDYTKIRVEREVPEVTEEMIGNTLEDLRKKSAEHVEVERPAAEGDLVEIDFVGSVDGQEFPGGASKNHPLVLGDKMFIPGFEEGVVGMSAGEEKDVEK